MWLTTASMTSLLQAPEFFVPSAGSIVFPPTGPDASQDLGIIPTSKAQPAVTSHLGHPH